jgi:hypothetical protein
MSNCPTKIPVYNDNSIVYTYYNNNNCPILVISDRISFLTINKKGVGNI